MMLNAPEVATLALGLALYLRTDTSPVPRIRELGMLVAARENDCQFIWNAHAPAGRRAGLRDDVVDALRDGKELPALAPDEAAVVNHGREFFREPTGSAKQPSMRRWLSLEFLDSRNSPTFWAAMPCWPLTSMPSGSSCHRRGPRKRCLSRRYLSK